MDENGRAGFAEPYTKAVSDEISTYGALYESVLNRKKRELRNPSTVLDEDEVRRHCWKSVKENSKVII